MSDDPTRPQDWPAFPTDPAHPLNVYRREAMEHLDRARKAEAELDRVRTETAKAAFQMGEHYGRLYARFERLSKHHDMVCLDRCGPCSLSAKEYLDMTESSLKGSSDAD